MHIGQIFKADFANGTGMRVSVFVSGCTNHCAGCFQPETWDFNYGREYTPEIEQSIMDELAKPYYYGLSILGGEPMELENQPTVANLIQRVKNELPGKTIWLYTGFTYDKDLVPGGKRYGKYTDQILDSIDVMVDGKFDADLKDLRLYFRGSSNQRIIEMKPTRKSGMVVLSPLNVPRLI